MEYIRSDLRIEAKRAAEQSMLLEQSEKLKEQFLDTYSKWERVNDQLGKTGPDLNPKIKGMIGDSLKPEYEIKKRMASFKSLLWILSAILGIGTFFIPGVFYEFGIYFFGIPTVVILILLAKDYLKLNPNFIPNNIKYLGSIFGVVVITSGAIFTVAGVSLIGNRQYYDFRQTGYTMLGFSAVCFVIAFAIIYITVLNPKLGQQLFSSRGSQKKKRRKNNVSSKY